MVSYISNPIIAIRQLLSNIPIVKEFLQYTKCKFNFDWERTIQEKPQTFIFTNLEFVKQNINGGPWFHIIVTEKDTIIISRDENTEEFYNNHIIFGTHYKPSRIINRIKPIYIISGNYIDFKLINKKQYFYSPDYLEYKCIQAQEKRKEKCLELQLFKLVYSLCSNIPYFKEESVYKNIIQNKLKEILVSDLIKKLCYPIQNVVFNINDFEIDYGKKKLYIENKLDYSFTKNNEIIKSKYNGIYPSIFRFKTLLSFNKQMIETIYITLFDNILQLIGGFTNAFKDNKKSLIIKNICNNGFSKELVVKFCHLL